MPTSGEMNEEFWHDYLMHPDTMQSAGRRLFSRIPRDPRCRLCASPFAGPGGVLMRVIGKRQSQANPNFGKFGEAHPSFGHTMSAESRARLSEMRRGEKNPNYGKTMSPEDRARRSAALKGRPRPSSVRSAHTRHHTNKGVFKETCRHCIDDQNNERGIS